MKKIVLLIFYFACCIINGAFAQGSWTTRANFSGSTRWASVGFSIGTKGYVVTGSNFANDLWEWDQPTNTWSQRANFPGPVRELGTGFSVGTQGYVCTGFSGSNYQDLWQYDQPTNTWAQKTSLGGAARQWAMGFSVGAKGYICGGYGTGYLPDFWQYDPVTDTWSQEATFGGGNRAGGVAFAIGGKGYVGLGCNSANYPLGYKDLWEYDTLANTWLQKANFPGSGRIEATAFTIGQYGYVGIGTTHISSGDTTDFWRFDPATNTWAQAVNYGGGLIEEVASFSIGCYGYIATGFVNDGISYNSNLWQYYDSTNATCSGCLLSANFISSDTTFCSESGKCINFTNLSSPCATSWQWFFPGAVPDTSTQENPTNICYYVPGTYPVTLIITNGTDTDSLAVTPLIIFATLPPPPTITIIGGDTLVSSHGSYYQWYFNGSLIAGATDSSYIANQGGTYSVEVTDSLGCNSLSSGVLITATENISGGEGIEIYPNPASQSLVISHWSLGRGCSIEVYNVLGEKVYGLQSEINPEKIGTKSEILIDVSSLTDGVYFLKINSGERTINKKFVVLHK